MPKHETKTCARCGKDFECKSGSILLCQCQTVYITEEELDFIAERYADCLCTGCLKSMKAEFNIRNLTRKIASASDGS